MGGGRSGALGEAALAVALPWEVPEMRQSVLWVLMLVVLSCAPAANETEEAAESGAPGAGAETITFFAPAAKC